MSSLCLGSARPQTLSIPLQPALPLAVMGKKRERESLCGVARQLPMGREEGRELAAPVISQCIRPVM